MQHLLPSKNKKGFTLVEVLVVLVIISILAAIAVPLYTDYVKGARASEAQTAIGAIWTASRIDYQKTGQWANDVTELSVDIDQSTLDKWDFDIVGGGGDNPPTMLTATSKAKMAGGEGKVVIYDVKTGEFSGYGTDDEDEGSDVQ